MGEAHTLDPDQTPPINVPINIHMSLYRMPWSHIRTEWPDWRDHQPLVDPIPPHIKERLHRLPHATGRFMIEATPDPTAQWHYHSIAERLGLAQAYVKIHIQEPGDLIPPHVDTELAVTQGDDTEYTKLRRIVRKAYKLESHSLHFHHMSDEQKEATLERVFVFLEDHVPGHIIMMQDRIIDTWRRGDVLWFDWRRCQHATSNISRVTRPILQITGVRTEQWHRIHESNRLTTIEI